MGKGFSCPEHRQSRDPIVKNGKCPVLVTFGESRVLEEGLGWGETSQSVA